MEIHIYSINVLPFILVNLVFTSTKTDASCFLPEDLTNAAWEYNYTDVSDSSEKSTTLNIATTTLQNSVINLSAVGTTMRDWTCINSLNISNTQTLVVFKSDTSFSSGPSSGNRRLYLCMKLTKVTNDLYYFHLLSDIETSVFPNERVFISEASNSPANDAPMCSTFCQYTDLLKIRTLRRPGTNDDLPNDAALCEPCDSACVVESKEFSSTVPNRTTSADLYITSIMTTEGTLESVKTPTASSTNFTESTKVERTSPTRPTPLDASCVLPADLNAAWEYNYTDVASNSEQSTTLNIGTTTLQNSVINLNAFGTAINDWTCINSLNISNAQTLVVFKSDISFTSGPSSGDRRLYLCMKFTKVTNDLYYFHLLSDIETSIFPNERVFISEAGNAPADEAPMCSTFCQYTDSLKIRTLRRPGTNDVLPNDAALCEPCGSDCIVESTEFSGTAQKRTSSAEVYRTTIMTTKSTLESVKTSTFSSTYFTESTKFERTAPTQTTPPDASCVLPEDLMNAAWEYNYTDVASNSEQSTTLNIGTTTLQNSVINLNASGTAINDWTCINSLNISNAQTLVVFK